MPTSATIPVTVDPQAAAGIDYYHLETIVDRMIDYARQHLPELDRIEVGLYNRADDDEPVGITIDVYSRRPFDPDELIAWRLGEWLVDSFPPEVLQRVHMSYYPGGGHAG